MLSLQIGSTDLNATLFGEETTDAVTSEVRRNFRFDAPVIAATVAVTSLVKSRNIKKELSSMGIDVGAKGHFSLAKDWNPLRGL